MGQRSMTYVITEGSYEGTTINTIYNQWNFVKLQAVKLERVVKYFTGFKKGAEQLFQTFFSIHGLSPEAGWVGGYVADKEYKEYDMKPFEEDNNNGWVIVKLIQGGDFGERSYKIELCCIWGSEDDKADTTTYKPVETKKYFSIEKAALKGNAEQIAEYEKTVDYIVQNTTYNPALKKEATNLIIKNLTNAKAAKTN